MHCHHQVSCSTQAVRYGIQIHTMDDDDKSNFRVSYLGEEAVREKCGKEEDSTEPRGVWQCDDLDWTLYYLDVGSLVQ